MKEPARQIGKLSFANSLWAGSESVYGQYHQYKRQSRTGSIIPVSPLGEPYKT